MVKIALKFSLAIGIIYYLIRQGKLDFSLAFKMLDHIPQVAAALAIIVSQCLVGSYRWKLLNEIKSECKLPFLKIVKLTWIGLFFNSILPGAVTGDLIKVVYAKDLAPNITKTFLVTSVIMDRIIGLIGLLLLLGIFSIYGYSELVGLSPQISALIHFNFLLFLGVLAFLVTLFLPIKIQNIFLNLSSKLPIVGTKVTKTLEQVWLIGSNKKVVIICLALSLIAQVFNVFAFWLISNPFYLVPLKIQHAFTFMPIGFMAIAVPISPAGLGVGHAIFNSLFKLFGIGNGASLFNLYFLAILFINLFGIFPYLLGGKRHTLAEAKG